MQFGVRNHGDFDMCSAKQIAMIPRTELRGTHENARNMGWRGQLEVSLRGCHVGPKALSALFAQLLNGTQRNK